MTAPTVFGADPAARVVKFAQHWHTPQDPDSYRLLVARLGPAVSRRRLAAVLAVALPCIAVYGWAAFSDSVPLRFGVAAGFSLAVAATSLVKALADARRDAALSRSLTRHVTRSRPLRVTDLLGVLETRLLLAVFGASCAGCLAAAVLLPQRRGLALGLAVVEVALAAVALVVLRVIASRPTVADAPGGLQVDLARRRNRATAAPLVAFYAGILPSFTVSTLPPEHPVKVLAVTALASMGCYLGLWVRLSQRHDGLLVEERSPDR